MRNYQGPGRTNHARLTREEHDEIIERLAEGWDYAQVRAHYNVSDSTILTLRREMAKRGVGAPLRRTYRQREAPRTVEGVGLTPYAAGAFAARCRQVPYDWGEFMRGWHDTQEELQAAALPAEETEEGGAE